MTDPGITSIPALDAAEQQAEAINIAEHILATGNLPAACCEPLCRRAIAPGNERCLGHAKMFALRAVTAGKGLAS